MVVPVDGDAKQATNASTKNNAKCEASDESEYSSLEDDDDVHSECDSVNDVRASNQYTHIFCSRSQVTMRVTTITR